MQFKARVRRKPVGLTSLIDVIFLLLLFFMLASSFTRYQSLDISSGAEGGGAAERPAYLRIHTSEKLDLNGRPLMKADMAKLFSALKENSVVAIWSGPDANVQDVVDVMSEVRRSGLKSVLVTGQ
ncbi:biopolymer transporter ExbD [Roseibium algicola]|uniref:ExbD/TolR family protein n=1 Tax=Roseibium TaxID=150830 RepID=UPI00345A1006